MIDKNSPKYPEYMKECHALTAELEKKEKEIFARLKEEGGFFGLDGSGFGELDREISVKLKTIQKKYGFD